MSKTGYFEHWVRDYLSNEEKRSVFQKTIESYNQSIKEKNYSLGFLIASSLLEDRIKSCYVLIEWRDRCSRILGTKPNEPLSSTIEYPSGWIERIKPTPNEVNSVRLESMLERIKNHGSISNNRKKKTLFLLEVRETLSSLSMWNSDRYSEENCKKFFQEFRYYDKVVRQIKSFE